VNEWAARIVVGAVVFVFVGNFVASVTIGGYTPDPTIGPVMGTIAGGALAYMLARRGNGNGNGS
jgi:hypothetical protein